MANSLSSKKRARQADKRREQNTGMRSMMRTSLKKVYYAIEAGDKEVATEAYKAAVPIIDVMARKGIIHMNKAARHKSRMNAQIKGL